MGWVRAQENGALVRRSMYEKKEGNEAGFKDI
jgi:hypothetical protein